MRVSWGALAVLAIACGGSSNESDPIIGTGQGTTLPEEPAAAASGAAAASSSPIPLRIAFIHGVIGDDDARKRADGELRDLETAVVAKLNERGSINGRKVLVATARVNLYTGDDGSVLSPGIDDIADGTGVPTATAWRKQLVAKTKKAFGDHGNIIFVGHSTGARVAAEVVANVGGSSGTPDSFDWGMRDKVAGIVTLHGMIDALGSPAYDFVGPTSYDFGCKLAQGDGWCDYSGKVSAVRALDWAAQNKHVLSLIGWGDCSPSLWTGENDKSLPLRAQGSPWVPGMALTPVPGGTYGPAHGTLYGKFCHSDLTNGGSPRHRDAVESASKRITEWLFDAAPRIVPGTNFSEPVPVPVLGSSVMSQPFAIGGGGCPAGRKDHGRPDVAGVCIHPGFFDGDDHPFDGQNHVETTDGSCTGSVRISHLHGGENHAARFWLKTYSIPEGGGLLSVMLPE